MRDSNYFLLFCRTIYREKVNPIRYTYLFFFASLVIGQDPGDLKPIVYNQMLLLKSKLDANPIVWQDTRQGYLRYRALRICDIALDNLDAFSADQIIGSYYPELDSLLIKIRDGKEFEVIEPSIRNYQVNYFYSSSRP